MANRIGAEGPYSLIPRLVLRPAEGERINIEDFWECLKSPFNVDSRRRKGVSAKAVARYYGRRSGSTFYSPVTGKCKSGPRLGRVKPAVVLEPAVESAVVLTEAEVVELFPTPTGDQHVAS